MDAQRSTRSRDRDRTETNELKENMWASLSIGNLFFFGDFSASLKGSFGYRPVKPVSVGVQAKIYYDFLNRPLEDFSLFTFGGGPEVRVDVVDQFYLLGEYNLMSIQGVNFNNQVSRNTFAYPAVGFGYRAGGGPRSPSAQLLFILDEEVRNGDQLGRAVDYWVELVYFF